MFVWKQGLDVKAVSVAFTFPVIQRSAQINLEQQPPKFWGKQAWFWVLHGAGSPNLNSCPKLCGTQGDGGGGRNEQEGGV